MTSIIHVMYGRTMESQPLLACAARSRCQCDNGRMVCIGGSDPEALAGNRVVRLHEHAAVHRDLEQWLRTADADLVIGWGAPALVVVARLSMPAAAVLDGLLDLDDRVSAVAWMRDRRLPVLVTAQTLAGRLDEATSGRARLTVMLPPLQGARVSEQEPTPHLVRIVAARPELHSMRPCFDLIVRLLLAGRPLRVEADPAFAQRSALSTLMQQLGAGTITTPDELQPALVAAAPLRGHRRGDEAVLPLIAAWREGATVLLPRGHAATEILSSVDGGVPDCDGDLAIATQVLDGLGPGPDRAAQVDAWCQTSGDCFELLLGAAQHS